MYDPVGIIKLYQTKNGSIFIMKTSISPKQFAEKLGVKNISSSDSETIQQWMDSISIEEDKTGTINSDQLKTKLINFNHLDKDQSLDIIKNLSTAYRYLFTNTYSEFIFYPSEGRKFSLPELLDLDPNTMFPIEAIYSFPIDCFRKESLLDKSIDEYPMFCHDSEITFQNIKQKLEKRGHAVVIHDEKTGNIVGFSFGYRSSLIEAWHLEEWVHPFVYSRLDQFLNKIQKTNLSLSKKFHEKYFNKFDDFLSKFNAVIQNNIDTFGGINTQAEFGPNDYVYLFNAVVTHPQIRRISKPSELCGACLSMPDEYTKKYMLTLGEAIFESNAYKMFQIGGMKNICGVLNQASDGAQKGDNILMLGPLSSVLEAALLPQREFMRRYIRFHRNAK